MNANNDLKKLRDWLADYALYREMRGPVDAMEEEPGQGREYDFSGEPSPAAGQIRLWPSADPGEDPLYGLLLPSGYGIWRVVPFSPLAFPAVPEEYRLFDEPPVRVMEGWNRRRLASAAARQSWRVETLDDAECFRLQSWLLSVEAGGSSSPNPGDRTGPPIHHPLDPRHDYLDLETARVDGCLGEPGAGVERGTVSDRQWAAEPAAAYGIRIWRHDPSGVRVRADASGIEVEAPADWNDARLFGGGGVELRWSGKRIPYPGANQVEWTRMESASETVDLRPAGGSDR